MRKIKLAAMTALVNISAIFAGGLLTNTNQSAQFLRNPAQDAATDIYSVYSNPAGVIKLPEGFHFSFNNQSAFQTRTIKTTFEPFNAFGGNTTKEFKGDTSAAIIPSLQGAYRKGNWALSGSIAVSGGGGKATFNNGLPSFEAPIAYLASQVGASAYSVDQYMKGSSMIIGAQLGGTYKINEMFSAYGGFRLNIVNNGYEGHLRNIKINPQHPTLNPTAQMMSATAFFDKAAAAMADVADQLAPIIIGGGGNYTVAQLIGAGQMSEAMAVQLAAGLGQNLNDFKQLPIQTVGLQYTARSEGYRDLSAMVADKNLDCTQSGWGISPIVGFNFSYDKLNIGVKYEFKTRLNVENKTKVDDTGLFKDGVNTPHDIPALFTIGASYKILPSLTASVGYHRFFDSDAKMDGDKQKHINGGTNEYIGGIEYQINPMFLVSGGVQLTKYGVKDGYQKDISFACSSYGIGLGGAANVSSKVRINVGYFWSVYSDYTKSVDKYAGTPISGKDVFSRTNKVFGAGVDFSF